MNKWEALKNGMEHEQELLAAVMKRTQHSP
jgi:hypothetical protein